LIPEGEKRVKDFICCMGGAWQIKNRFHICHGGLKKTRKPAINWVQCSGRKIQLLFSMVLGGGGAATNMKLHDQEGKLGKLGKGVGKKHDAGHLLERLDGEEGGRSPHTKTCGWRGGTGTLRRGSVNLRGDDQKPLRGKKKTFLLWREKKNHESVSVGPDYFQDIGGRKLAKSYLRTIYCNRRWVRKSTPGGLGRS